VTGPDLLEAHAERVDPEPVGVLRVTGGDVASFSRFSPFYRPGLTTGSTDRGAEGAELDAVADVLNGLVDHGAGGQQPLGRGGDVPHAPVGAGAARGVPAGGQAELVAAGGEPDIERLVEVGPGAQHVGPPRLGRGHVGGGVHDGAKSEKHRSSSSSMADGCAAGLRCWDRVKRWPAIRVLNETD